MPRESEGPPPDRQEVTASSSYSNATPVVKFLKCKNVLSEKETGAIRRLVTTPNALFRPLQDVIKDAEALVPGVKAEVVLGIMSFHAVKRIRQTRIPASKLENMADAWSKGESTFMQLAKDLDMPPCSIVRKLLSKVTNSTFSPKDVTMVLRQPSIIVDEELRSQVEECVKTDWIMSPRADYLREGKGLEAEWLLQRKLQNLGARFLEEGQLRERGHARTPDIMLQVPLFFGSSGKRVPINWIDSKSLFCDYGHARQMLEQLAGYVNRFGRGLVIFWGGYNVAAVKTFPPEVSVSSGLQEGDVVVLKHSDFDLTRTQLEASVVPTPSSAPSTRVHTPA